MLFPTQFIITSGGSRISRRGRRPRSGGGQLLRQLCFEKFVCQNKRIWTLWGGGAARRRRSPGPANDYHYCITNSLATAPGIHFGSTYPISPEPVFCGRMSGCSVWPHHHKHTVHSIGPGICSSTNM